MPKHRAPRYVRTKQALAGVPVAAGATVVGLGVLSTPAADAATTHDWSGVAQCESGGDWHIDTGNGFYGGLQFTQSTWAADGGTAFAARADLATPAQQVTVAERVLATQGIGAWPVCGKHLMGGTTAVADAGPAVAAAPKVAVAPKPAVPQPVAPKVATPEVAAPQVTAPKHASSETATRGKHAAAESTAPRHAAPAGGDTYTVQPGDTLAEIAASHHVTGGWHTIFENNRASIADPNLILVGQQFVL